MYVQNNQEIIYRIVSGEQNITLNGVTYKIRTPNNSLRIEAEALYIDTMRKNRFNTYWLTDRMCLGLLVNNGICTADIDKNMETMEKTIEDLKVGLFTSMFIPDIHSDKKKQLQAVKKKQKEMIVARHSLDHLTLKGYASMVKNQFLIYSTTYDSDGNRVWENPEDINILLLERISNKVLENAIDPITIRTIARTEPWRSYWNIKKTDVFEGSVFNYTDEQKSLILYSKMYDSAYEHPECPTEEVINDDDLFDGWMISQHRKVEKQKMTAQLEGNMSKGKKSKLSNSDEIFLVAKSEEDRARIEGMNDAAGSIIKAQRRATIKKHGTAKDAQFMDRKLGMQQQSNSQFMSVRGKK